MMHYSTLFLLTLRAQFYLILLSSSRHPMFVCFLCIAYYQTQEFYICKSSKKLESRSFARLVPGQNLSLPSKIISCPNVPFRRESNKIYCQEWMLVFFRCCKKCKSSRHFFRKCKFHYEQRKSVLRKLLTFITSSCFSD